MEFTARYTSFSDSDVEWTHIAVLALSGLNMGQLGVLGSGSTSESEKDVYLAVNSTNTYSPQQ